MRCHFPAPISFIPALLIAATAAIPVGGQESGVTSDGADTDTAASSPPVADAPIGPGVDEVIVTAGKRVQDIREIPLSVSTVSGDYIRENVATLDVIVEQMPNVYMDGDGGQINVRGIGTTTSNPLNESSVSVVIDDVYYGQSTMLATGGVDIDRISVIRGPQGSLYGKNAVAGVVTVETRKPNLSEWGVGFFGGFGTSKSVGGKDNFGFDSYVNIPVIEDVAAFRGSYAWLEYKPFMKNTKRNFETPFDLEATIYRPRAKVQFNDAWSLDVYMEGSLIEVPNGLCLEVTQSTDAMAAVYSQFDPNWDAVRNDRCSTEYKEDFFRDDQRFVGTLNGRLLNHDLVLIGSFGQQDAGALIDADMGPAPLLFLDVFTDYTQQSLELRVLSDDDGDFSYIAGLYYFHSNNDGYTDLRIGEIDPLVEGFADIILPALLESDLGSIVDNIASTGITAERTEGFHDQDNNTYAVYAQATWSPLDWLDAVIGLRYTHEEKPIRFERTFSDTAIVLRSTGGAPFVVNKNRIEKDWSPQVSLKFDLTDEVKGYFTYGRAFKSGGYSTAAVQESELEFDKETSDTLEAGVKGRYLDGQLNLNVGTFYTKFEDMQLFVYNGFTYIVGNAAAATSWGLEVDGTFVPVEGLDLHFSAGYLNISYDSFKNGPCPAGSEEPSCDLSGERTPHAPEFTGSFAPAYSFPIANTGMMGTVTLSATYMSEMYLGTQKDPNMLRDAALNVGAIAAVSGNDGAWRISFAAGNLLDEDIPNSIGDVPLFAGSYWSTYEAKFEYGLLAQIEL